MKKLLLFLFLPGVFCFSQDTKEMYKTYQDFGFQKQPKKVSLIQYEFKDKVVIDQSKETYLFNELGNISSIVEVNYMDNSTTETSYTYQNGLLTKECAQLQKTLSLARCIDYTYNDKKQLVKKVLQSNEYTETTVYAYKNDRLDQVVADFESDSKLLQEFFYNAKGDLYLIKSTETLSDGKNYFSTEAYLKDKLLFQRDHQGHSSFLYHEEPNMKIQFLIKGNKIIQNLQKIEQQLAKNDSDVAKDFSMLIGQNFLNDAEMKTQNITVFKRNEHQDYVATGTTNDPKKPLQNIAFREIEYADGTKSGTEDFDFFIYNELNKMK